MERLDTAPEANRGSRTNEIQRLNYTHGDAVNQFKNAILDAGIIPPDNIICDGQLHRFKIDGKLNGAYVLHLDGKAAGYFEDFKQGVKHTWKQSGKFMPLSEFQRQDLAKKKALDAATRKAEETAKHKAAAEKAAYIWQHATPAPANHPYLLRKRIKPHGARLGRDNTLVIPLHNKHGELVNLQFISETGGKRFLSGGLKKGCFYWIGHPKKAARRVLICEGFATGASLQEDSHYSTVIAFDAGNLKDVAINIKNLAPCAEIVLCGDNDLSGVGQKAAREAAQAIGGKYIIPKTPGNDWNDEFAGGSL